MYKKTALVAAIGIALSAAAQADYQFEVSGGYATGNITAANGPEADQDIISLAGIYYLAPVSTSTGPLSEAAFIDRASGVMFGVVDGEVDFDSGFSGDTDITAYDIAGRYVMKDSGFLVEASYRLEQTDIDTLAPGSESTDTDVWSIGAGMYVAENTTLLFNYTYFDADNGRESDGYSADLEHLFLLDQGAIKIDASYGLLDSNFADDVDLYALGGTYYINNNIGIGGRYTLRDSNQSELTEWRAVAEWFISEQLSFTGAYIELDEDGSQAESDAIIFEVSARF
jgi:hypothetical protein